MKKKKTGLEKIIFEGKLHCEDGPLIVVSNNEFFYLNNIKYETKHLWQVEIYKLRLKHILEF